MSDRRSTTQRRRRAGVALLLVVAALALVVVGAAALAAMASTARASKELDRSDDLASELLAAVHAPLAHWLEHEASTIALPPETETPATPVLSESWEIDGRSVELDVTAFDQLGMTPWEHARGASQLRLVLPVEVVTAVDAAESSPSTTPGLDLLEPSEGRAVFPSRAGEPESALPALGALVATHSGTPARINASTAPRELLAQAFRAAGRGGIEAAMASRRAGKPAPVPSEAATRPSRAADAWRVELVGSSDVWSFRIDLRSGSLRRSWWEVWRRGSESRWECVQRLAIPS